MADQTEDTLYEMSDEELEAAFKDAKAGIAELDEDNTDDGADEVEEVDEDLDSDEEDETEDDDIDNEDVEDNDEEYEDEESEQPDNDEDSENEEDEEATEEETAEDLDEDTEDNLDAEEDESQEAVEPTVHRYKANGQDFEFTDDEIKEQFGKVFGQSMNYTQKMQEIAPWRKTISALQDNDLSHDDVNLMIDVLKGDKDAIASVVQKAGIDMMELDTEKEVAYSPREYGRSEQELAIDEVIGSISKDQEYSITQHVVDKAWDDRSRQELAKNPKMIQGLHNDIKAGVYDSVSPMAMKLKVLDGGTKSDIEYYMEAGSKYYANLQANEEAKVAQAATLKAQEEEVETAKAEEAKAVQEVKQRKVKQKQIKKAAVSRKAAATPKKVSGKKGVIDYLDESEEAFDDWYKKVMSN